MAKAKEYEIHPFAKHLPSLPDDELKELAEDIKENGLRFSIIRAQGKIVDGVNRLKACQLAGIEPGFKDRDDVLQNDVDIAKFIISMNVMRRQLSASQRATIAVELYELAKKAEKELPPEPEGEPGEEGEPEADPGEKDVAIGRKLLTVEELPEDGKPKDGMTMEKAAEAAGASMGYVVAAKNVKDKDPAKYEEIKAGKKTVNKASREISAAQSDEKSEKEYGRKAHKLVEKCCEKIAELGYRFVDSTIEKMD